MSTQFNHWSFEWLWPSVRQCPREGRPHCLRLDAGSAGRNAPQAADVKKFAHDNKVDFAFH